jgi:class 3 adenylate cyclase
MRAGGWLGGIIPPPRRHHGARSAGSRRYRIAAILAADIADYSRLIETREEGAFGRLKALRAEMIDPTIAGHHGRIVKTTGDSDLAEFASVIDATPGLDLARRILIGSARSHVLGWCHRSTLTVVVLCGEPPSG